jgi:hypothetical protein
MLGLRAPLPIRQLAALFFSAMPHAQGVLRQRSQERLSVSSENTSYTSEKAIIY